MKYFVSLISSTLNDHEVKLLESDKIGGVVLYGRNILSLATTHRLINSIKSLRADFKIAIDEEGGIVSRISHLFPSYSQPYCATLPLAQVREYYRKRSRFLKELGVDINFAPVVDIALNENSYLYKRSFGSNPKKIIELAKVCVEEQKQAGILSSLKHFPGHGRSEKDSHKELPVVNISPEEWKRLEGKIFSELISFGVDYVMVGHLLFPKIREEITSISPYWIKGILKEKLGFKGIVIADDICMKGLADSFKVDQLDTLTQVGLDAVIITEQEHPLLKSSI